MNGSWSSGNLWGLEMEIEALIMGVISFLESETITQYSDLVGRFFSFKGKCKVFSLSSRLCNKCLISMSSS